MQFVLDVRRNGAACEVHLLRGDAPVLDAAGAPLVRPLAPLDPAHEQIFERIVLRRPDPGDMVTLGTRLFEMLIGREWWAHINGVPDPVELVIACDALPEIERLPWEMMHLPDAGSRFVAEEPLIGLVRRVGGSTAAFRPIPSPPKVLIAIGTELHRDVIRPGAECLALLQNLRHAKHQLRLRTNLLMRASPLRLAEAIADFKPDVVHFICHGDVDRTSRRGYLELVHDDDARRSVHAYSETLLGALGPEATRPSIVVLSACYTGAASLSDVGQVAMPLARELGMHVPLVVGMSGAITDQACRLFARRFYESLMTDGDVAQAASAGRRAALTSLGTDPQTSVEWTMPIVYVSQAAKSTTVPVDQPSPEIIAWGKLAAGFAKREDPVFCDRVEVINRFDLLMAPADLQRELRTERTDLQVVAIAATDDGDRKFGLSRALKELAAKAATDGHVPVLVRFLAQQWPKKLPALLSSIMAECTRTRNLFGIAGAACPNLHDLLRHAPTIPLTVDARIVAAFPPAQHEAHKPGVLAMALRLDLQKLLDEIKPRIPADRRDHARIVLLLDDVHEMDAAAIDLAGALLEAGGTRDAPDEIRVVLAYDADGGPATSGTSSALQALKTLRENTWVDVVPLQRFAQPHEDRHAYERYLLHWRDATHQGLAVREGANPEMLEWFWTDAEKVLEGVPSRLVHRGPEIVQRCLSLPPGVGFLRAANDDDILVKVALEKRGGV